MFFLLYESIVGNVGHALKGLHLRPSIDAARLLYIARRCCHPVWSCLRVTMEGNQGTSYVKDAAKPFYVCISKEEATRGTSCKMLQNQQLIYN